MNTIIKTSDFLGDFVLDKWNRQYKWLRRINRVTPKQLVSDTQRVSDYKGTNRDKHTYYYFKKFAKRFLLKDYNKKYEVIKNNSVDLNKALLSEKSFKELFQTDVDKIQNKQQIIDDINAEHRESYERFKKYSNKPYEPLSEKEIEDKLRFSGYIGHRIFDLSYTLKDVFKRVFKKEEYYTLQKFLTDYEGAKKENEGRSYLMDIHIYDYLNELFDKPVYRLGGGFSMRDEIVKEYKTYSDLSNNMNWMQITHFGNDEEYILSDENYKNQTIAFWVFDECVVWQDGGGRSTW